MKLKLRSSVNPLNYILAERTNGPVRVTLHGVMREGIVLDVEQCYALYALARGNYPKPAESPVEWILQSEDER